MPDRFRTGLVISTPLLEACDITVGYPQRSVLAHLDLTIQPGALVGLVGPTGCGKSTLIKALTGAVPLQGGEVLFAGGPLAQRPAGAIGYVPQEGELDLGFPVTVEQVILMGMGTRRALLPWASRTEKQRIARLAERLGILSCLHHAIRDISGGQRQRTLIARALVGNPRLLVLDEPTSGVDMHTQQEVLHLLAELHREGMTILICTHDLNEIALALPWVICFNGSVVDQGPPLQVFSDGTLQRTFGEALTLIQLEGHRLVVHKAPVCLSP